MVLNFLKSGFNKIKSALAKTGSLLGNKIRDLFSGKIDQEKIDQLEQLFYESDLGVQTSIELTEKVQKIHRKNPDLDSEALIAEIRKEISEILSDQDTSLKQVEGDQLPLVIMIVGVNGNGKTTSVAKLAKKYKDAGNRVLVAATDTFRAAGVEQLETWANRVGVDIVKGAAKSDPAAVAFDALTAAKSRGADVLIIDTAGRLHTRQDLMQELQKIRRSCEKVHPGSPHETLMVLDATTGQNAIDQAKIFNEFTPISGLLLTKLDGTSKGGVVVNIHRQLNIPVKFIGLGEGVDDLQPFEPKDFAQALLD